ncbi:hypothetical protein SNOG_11898 [Parastagonospora nodorum SN15]|uniref:Uncharacterized protein n=1 Tax=Phaeosphaeria nodorum (strain SN15 / ATCC MYA-4574 / FGSC 10173) TaxID=321614 RepID=Q0U8L6_PHANO|nr:hypothetical protein SNOG_11898 [Parastagonospora nodorum SN15]EAT80942.1 hypothetical protein SNOG_11898 [Parastagonospora nodorum SN15]
MSIPFDIFTFPCSTTARVSFLEAAGEDQEPNERNDALADGTNTQPDGRNPWQALMKLRALISRSIASSSFWLRLGRNRFWM